jgi:hypothetical protein
MSQPHSPTCSSCCYLNLPRYPAQVSCFGVLVTTVPEPRIYSLQPIFQDPACSWKPCLKKTIYPESPGDTLICHCTEHMGLHEKDLAIYPSVLLDYGNKKPRMMFLFLAFQCLPQGLAHSRLVFSDGNRVPLLSSNAAFEKMICCLTHPEASCSYFPS